MPCLLRSFQLDENIKRPMFKERKKDKVLVLLLPPYGDVYIISLTLYYFIIRAFDNVRETRERSRNR